MATPKPKIKTAYKQWLQDLGDRVMRWIIDRTRNWSRRPEVLRNNYELGRQFLKNGQPGDAVMRFKIVTWMEPNEPEAWYYLGCAFLANQEPVLAVNALKRALSLKADYEEASYMLALAGGLPEQAFPKTIPLSMTKEHFDELAPGFSQEQLEVYQYRGHALLAEALKAQLQPEWTSNVVVELGSGSGLLGPLMRGVSTQLIGVDISPAMLAEAEQLQGEEGKKVYDALINRDVREFLNGVADEAFDIVISAGTLSYVGELDALVAGVARVLRKGGFFAFTADKMEGEGFKLDTGVGRFRFSKPYLEGLAAKNNLAMLKLEEAEIYPEYEAWLGVFRKNSQ